VVFDRGCDRSVTAGATAPDQRAAPVTATGGAIVSHLTFLGIEVQGDKGLLFFLAVVVLVTSAITLYLHRMQIPVLGERF